VLSRPEVRLRYDTLRSKYLGVAGPYGSLNRSSGASTGYEPFVPVGFTTQRDNFGRVQREAGATAQDTRERMRVERFRNLPLSEKKVIRYIDFVLTLTQTKILVSVRSAASCATCYFVGCKPIVRRARRRIFGVRCIQVVKGRFKGKSIDILSA
jgi:hypothetical protein